MTAFDFGPMKHARGRLQTHAATFVRAAFSRAPWPTAGASAAIAGKKPVGEAVAEIFSCEAATRAPQRVLCTILHGSMRDSYRAQKGMDENAWLVA